MATELKDLPPGSQQSTSDLSDPPEFSDDEMREMAVNMAPITRRQSAYTLTDKQPETNGKEAPLIPAADTGSASNDDEIEAEIHVSSSRAPRRRVPSKRSQLPNSKTITSRQPAAKRPKTNTKKWEPDYVTQSSKSPLVGKDLRALLLHPQAWDLLAEEDKKEVLALFPDNKHILDFDTSNARPDVMSLQNDDNFRHDTEDYVSNLSRDMHDPTWLQDAWAAHGSRAAGNFDHFYVRRLEADWKTTIPDDMKPDNLRSAPKPEALLEVDRPAEGGEALINGAADDHGDRDHEVAKKESDDCEVSDTIMVSGTNGSTTTEDKHKVDGKVDADITNGDVPKNHTENGTPTNGVNGIEKAFGPDANTNEDKDGASHEMRTGPE
ncbi:hypothetical protein VMCG_02994 [Cytospora schulzeri]|uniref:ASX DEUBAD domain-containing protein n=1 Tax=Cytospora schulzeri TaxID=448051 RepID=A0A423WZT9_9PEZI|nr:hypothetical protein VMCG_02994 [Valsa malicola]